MTTTPMTTTPDDLMAHTPPPGGDWHRLRDHLDATAELAAGFADAFGAADLARQVGLLHDIGKARPEFQRYLRLNHEQPGKKHQTIDHKGAGTLAALTVWEPLAFLIDGHHGGLKDGGELRTKLKELRAGPNGAPVLDIATRAGLVPARPADLAAPAPLPREALALWLRMLFSALVDADHTDTARHMNPDHREPPPAPAIAELAARLRDDQARFAAPGAQTGGPDGLADDVARVRNEVYRACLAAADERPGFFRLTVPTGGGKTRSGLAFALEHAARHGQRRVIVALPYLAITEQTSKTFREVLGERAVLEHYSGAGDRVADDGRDAAGAQDDAATWRRTAAATWDAPVVVTTTVQLFESLFADRTARCRKLHRIARSVLILDEVQSLPPGLLAPILTALRVLVDHFGVTVVFSTATQPALGDAPGFADLKAVTREIVPDPADLFARLRRVTYTWPEARETQTWDQVAARMAEADQALAVVNTRADALKLLDALGALDPGDRPLHLSTLLCGAHRRDVLADIRGRLERGEPCRVVSTQVVEAGVDLDFPLVLRALGPLDRVVQAAGRCNRNGRLAGLGEVVVFRPEEGGLPPGAYRIATQITESMLAEGGVDPDDPESFRRYFKDLFGTVTLDAKGIGDLNGRQAFATIAEEFRMIEDDGETVLVDYRRSEGKDSRDREEDDWQSDEATNKESIFERLVGRLERAGAGRGRPGQAQQLMREAQPWTVSMRGADLKRAADRGFAREVLPEFWIWTGNYHATRGLSWSDLSPGALISG